MKQFAPISESEMITDNYFQRYNNDRSVDHVAFHIL